MTKKIALRAASAATVAAMWYAGVFDAFRETERVKALLLGWGAWGSVLYVVCFALFEPQWPLVQPPGVWAVAASVAAAALLARLALRPRARADSRMKEQRKNDNQGDGHA